MWLNRLFRTGEPHRKTAQQLYLDLVQQSRMPEFYLNAAVSDTVDGRFDMIVLHMFLVLRRARGEGDEARDLGQALFDLMFLDMDRSLREMGVGDHSIGGRLKQIVAAFYGRVEAYGGALDGDDGTLEAALRRNVYRDAPVADETVAQLARYVRRQTERLAGQSISGLLQGKLVFESPLRLL